MNAVAVVATNWLYHSHSEVMYHLAFRLVHVMWYNLESIPLQIGERFTLLTTLSTPHSSTNSLLP